MGAFLINFRYALVFAASLGVVVVGVVVVAVVVAVAVDAIV